MFQNRFTIGVTVLFLILSGALLLGKSGIGSDVHFIGDGTAYNWSAQNLLKIGVYSEDGIRPSSDREPGYSAFIALTYFLAGTDASAIPLFIAQVLVILVSTLFFSVMLSRFFPKRESQCTYMLILTLPVIYHAAFATVREGFTFALFLSMCAVLLSFLSVPLGTRSDTSLAETEQWKKAIVLGMLFSALILTYFTFFFLPLVLVPLLYASKVRWKHILLFLVTTYAVTSLWGVRNFKHFEHFHFIDERRQHVVWYVRSVQAEHIRGIEPLRCLWSEYISRDWTGRSHVCSFNGAANTQGRVFTDDDIRASYERLKQYFPHYLWFSLFEILELHLPYVNGWGTYYNVLVSLSTMLIYFGCFFAMLFSRRDHAYVQMIFLLILLYHTGVFILTDATPRYLVPVLGLYAFFAARGFLALSDRVRSRSS